MVRSESNGPYVKNWCSCRRILFPIRHFPVWILSLAEICSVENVPDATTLLKFRRLLIEHALTRKLFDEIGISLCERGLMMKEGTLVDATIIEAPPSTKNAGKSRDPAMHQTKKGNEWHFGMKAHVGVDADSGLVHSVAGTAANVSDVSRAHLLRSRVMQHDYG